MRSRQDLWSQNANQAAQRANERNTRCSYPVENNQNQDQRHLYNRKNVKIIERSADVKTCRKKPLYFRQAIP